MSIFELFSLLTENNVQQRQGDADTNRGNYTNDVCEKIPFGGILEDSLQNGEDISILCIKLLQW